MHGDHGDHERIENHIFRTDREDRRLSTSSGDRIGSSQRSRAMGELERGGFVGLYHRVIVDL